MRYAFDLGPVGLSYQPVVGGSQRSGLLLDQGQRCAGSPSLDPLLAAQALLNDGAPDDISARLTPLARDDSAWRFSARELQALLQHRQGDIAGARAAFKALSEDASTPPGIRSRAEQMLAALGSGS